MNNKLTIQDFIGKKIAVTFESYEQKEQFLDLCAKNGMNWGKGICANDYIPEFYEKNGKSCDIAIAVRKNDRMLTWAWRSAYEKDGFKIIPASVFLRSESKIRKFRCTGYKGTDSCRDFAVGKVYEEINGIMFGDSGFRYENIKGRDPHEWISRWCIFEEIEAPVYEVSIKCDDKKTTTARLIVDGIEVKQAKSRCSSDDKFNLATGVKIAVERLFAKKGEKEL
nr:MAG TPA: hypothetical protein [Caudoviricetes sp.]